MRLTIVDALSGETVMESIDNLPNFDDTVWVMGSVDTDTARSPQSFVYSSEYIPRLNRVRKILEETTNREKADVARHLEDILARSVQGFEEVHQAKNRSIAASEGGVILSAPDEYWRSTISAPSAVYLLSELGVHEALPILANLFSSEHTIPINHVFLFYAMHLLVVDHPRDGLSKVSLELLDEYLTATLHLTEPEYFMFLRGPIHSKNTICERKF